MTSDQDDEFPVPDRDPDIRRTRRRIGALILGALIVAGVALLALGGSPRPELDGVQRPSLDATVGDPGDREWVWLTPVDRSVREGFPVPMIARGEQVCFAFGRVDFDPPRPSLSRCVQADEIPELQAEGLISLVVVRAGTDMWHLLSTGGELSSVRLAVGGGETIDEGRVHIDGELIALRLDTAETLTGMDWIIGRTRFVCTPAADAVETGDFCAPAGSSPG